MSWTDGATWVGTGIGIASALCSVFMWNRTRKYYNKIVTIEDVEKINICITEIDNCITLYNQIITIIRDAIVNDNHSDALKKLVKIQKKIQVINKELPIRYKESLDLLENSTYIDLVVSGNETLSDKTKLLELRGGFELSMDTLKSGRDKLRGI